MGVTRIQWTATPLADGTLEDGYSWNPWWGCTKVSPGCANCYAERESARHKGAGWGRGEPRPVASDNVWSEPFRWNKRCKKDGIRRRVFCASMCDVLDQEMPIPWRALAMEVIRACTSLDWLVLTKRHEHLAEIPTGVDGRALPHVWQGVSVENARTVRDRVPALLHSLAAVRFLSVEPLLEPVYAELRPFIRELDWIILGGESGHNARPCSAAWFAPIVEDCLKWGVPVFVKQMGTFWSQEHRSYGVTSKKGDDPNEWPESIRFRQWPKSRAA